MEDITCIGKYEFEFEEDLQSEHIGKAIKELNERCQNAIKYIIL